MKLTSLTTAQYVYCRMFVPLKILGSGCEVSGR